MTVQALFYPTLILILAVFLLVTVPRDVMRTLLPYGVVLGGLVDVVCHLLFGNLLKVFSYTNVGVFDVGGGLLIFAPLAWTLVIVFYLYFWPVDNRHLGYFYGLAWSLLATAFGQVILNAELFSYTSWFYPLPMLIIFVLRFAFITWVAKPWKGIW